MIKWGNAKRVGSNLKQYNLDRTWFSFSISIAYTKFLPLLLPLMAKIISSFPSTSEKVSPIINSFIWGKHEVCISFWKNFLTSTISPRWHLDTRGRSYDFRKFSVSMLSFFVVSVDSQVKRSPFCLFCNHQALPSLHSLLKCSQIP